MKPLESAEDRLEMAIFVPNNNVSKDSADNFVYCTQMMHTSPNHLANDSVFEFCGPNRPRRLEWFSSGTKSAVKAYNRSLAIVEIAPGSGGFNPHWPTVEKNPALYTA